MDDFTRGVADIGTDAWVVGIGRSPRKDWTRRRILAIHQEGLRGQGVLGWRRRRGPEDRERVVGGRSGGKCADRDELTLLTVLNGFNLDGLKLATAVASAAAGESQGRCSE